MSEDAICGGGVGIVIREDSIDYLEGTIKLMRG